MSSDSAVRTACLQASLATALGGQRGEYVLQSEHWMCSNSAPVSMGHSLIIYTVSIRIKVLGVGTCLNNVLLCTPMAVQIINGYNYCVNKAASLDIATGQLKSSECDCQKD